MLTECDFVMINFPVEFDVPTNFVMSFCPVWLNGSDWNNVKCKFWILLSKQTTDDALIKISEIWVRIKVQRFYKIAQKNVGYV